MRSIRPGMMLALLAVPAIALAAPRKKPRPRKAEPAETEPQTAAPPAPEPAPAVAPSAGATPPPAPAPTVAPAPAQPPAATPGVASPPPEPREGQAPADVDALRQEYLALRDELFASRARANVIASQLYSTRMSVRFSWGSARHHGVTRASIRLDGATVYEDATGAIAADDGVRFEGHVAPGRHLITFHVEAIGKDDDTFTSTTEAQVTVQAVADKDLVVAAKGRDSGDIAHAWRRRQAGSYGLGIDVAVSAVPRSAPAKGSR